MFLLILLLGHLFCFSQVLKLDYKSIDSVVESSENANKFLLSKKCIDVNKDTISYFDEKEGTGLVKVVRAIFNPSYKKDLRKDYWTFYFLKSSLILVSNGHIVDLGRVYSYTKYYYNNRKYFYRYGIKYNLKSPEMLLKQGDNYLKNANEKACM